MLSPQNAVLVVVDVQGSLAVSMHEKERLFKALQDIITGAKILDIPIVCTEQAPDKIGSTVPEIAELLSGLNPVKKTTFSCVKTPEFGHEIGPLKREQIILVGIEAHVCVYQTAADLINLGYYVQVVTDAVSSRTFENKQIGLERIREVGGSLTSVETILCELMGSADHPKFKQILGLIKT